MTDLTRRTFLSTAGTTVAASALLSTWAQRAGAAPVERVRHAVIGLGGQGHQHAREFDALDDCDVVALCDVDPERLAHAHKEIGGGSGIRLEKEFERILEDATIDSVSIVTADHWHTPIALHALKAGKHVYVEKPCSHNVLEGKILLEAADRSGKCVQHGTQSRSSPGIQEAVAWLAEGHLGKVRLAKAINHQMRGPIGHAAVEEPPAGVDYDRWLGPAPKAPFTKNRWHYQWHWNWDYGCGDMGNDGIHQVDQARWGLGVGYPKAISASGGQLFYDDDHQTPDTQMVTFEYDDCYLVYEMRLWTSYKLEGHDNGVVFYGDKGILENGREGCFYTLTGGERTRLSGGIDLPANVRNFIDCVKAGTPGKLHAPMKEAVASATLCHLGNIATRVGRRLHWDAENWTCTGDGEANKLLTREYRKGYELPV
ncbi:MAG: Gfo/Idh/MocA family oxidoreductase [Candidatus Hydrogenedentes bacterium]|nr:Gfo/Idh/MocA family oxidoreductase [Candidatus Hydrogenedentota bacterium]